MIPGPGGDVPSSVANPQTCMNIQFSVALVCVAGCAATTGLPKRAARRRAGAGQSMRNGRRAWRSAAATGWRSSGSRWCGRPPIHSRSARAAACRGPSARSIAGEPPSVRGTKISVLIGRYGNRAGSGQRAADGSAAANWRACRRGAKRRRLATPKANSSAMQPPCSSQIHGSRAAASGGAHEARQRQRGEQAVQVHLGPAGRRRRGWRKSGDGFA
jgi:hypothetical protein